MRLTHFDDEGKALMVDVSKKPSTERIAIAKGSVYMRPETLMLIKNKKITKGDVFGVARIAGIMAAKKTSDLIPLCHPLNITSINIDFETDDEKGKVDIYTTVKITGQTGVEMEALVAASVAALTIYDMCKAVDKEMVVCDIMLLEKRGGKSGTFKRK
jgi:cyclic pyranopterin phosphate synthase